MADVRFHRDHPGLGGVAICRMAGAQKDLESVENVSFMDVHIHHCRSDANNVYFSYA